MHDRQGINCQYLEQALQYVENMNLLILETLRIIWIQKGLRSWPDDCYCILWLNHWILRNTNKSHVEMLVIVTQSLNINLAAFLSAAVYLQNSNE